MFTDLSSYLRKPEKECVDILLQNIKWDEKQSTNTQDRTKEFIGHILSAPKTSVSLEKFFQTYALDSDEGMALMTLAEALLRVPDSKTVYALIKDKVSAIDWLDATTKDKSFLTKAAGLGLNLTSMSMNSILSKLGQPFIRKALMHAMEILGGKFVLGQTIQDGMKNAKTYEKQGYKISYDMLGEGARTLEDAEKYYDSYCHSLENIPSDSQSGLSVKLSALHPRYEYTQRKKSLPFLVERLISLCEQAAQKNIHITIDAEEVDRLDLSLEIIASICSTHILKNWDGFGLAVQAYQKRSYRLLDHLHEMAVTKDCKFHIRLVKGAYWDTEIKEAQVMGLDDYPVFTRKSNTDLSYLACAQKLLSHKNRLYPMFGTHNAHTVAAIIELAENDVKGFEFQRLFGMGAALYSKILEEDIAPVNIYAPIGPYEDLLPYLVRRLLENGANSSFVNQIYDEHCDIDQLSADPVLKAKNNKSKKHPKIPLPQDLYGNNRKNSAGIDLSDENTVQNLFSEIKTIEFDRKALPYIHGHYISGGITTDIVNPANSQEIIGTSYAGGERQIDHAFESLKIGYPKWSAVPADTRANILEKLADLIEENRSLFISLLIQEAGKTISDALGEVREAADFCRYYAMRGRIDFNENGKYLDGPTGETNQYILESRGIFVCISPWNFPLAIFTGQITAALMAGNVVLAKPAEQTPLTAHSMIQLMLQAGIPSDAISFLPGDSHIGEKIIQHPDIAGVAFTGSTYTAQNINRALASKDGPIARFLAETGGQNAMIVDSSALTEQVVDDLLISSFGSCGQRCSATRILFVQDDIADRTLRMLRGAMEELKMGDPKNISTDIGPVIDEQALQKLQRHKSRLKGFGHKIAETPIDNDLKKQGYFFTPIAYEIDDLKAIKEEIFGPILHVIRYSADKIDTVYKTINDTGYGLTLGIHSRIKNFTVETAQKIHAGNTYINRSTIGAVVGTQPFGGQGLSGTGPKAGGPLYLHAFAHEKVISTDTTAAGGNTSLVMLAD